MKSKLTTREKQLNIELNGTRLEQVDSFKLLGLEIDEELSFDNHTDSLSKKYLETRGSLSPEQILTQKCIPGPINDNLRSRLELLILFITKYVYNCEINVVPLNCTQFINNFKTQWKIER